MKHFYSLRAIAHCARRPFSWTWFFFVATLFPLPVLNYFWLGAIIAETAAAMEEDRRPHVTALFTFDGVTAMFVYGFMQVIGFLFCGVGQLVAWYFLWFMPEAGGAYGASAGDAWATSRILIRRDGLRPIIFIFQAAIVQSILVVVFGVLSILLEGILPLGRLMGGEFGVLSASLIALPLAFALVLAALTAMMATIVGGYAVLKNDMAEEIESALVEAGASDFRRPGAAKQTNIAAVVGLALVMLLPVGLGVGAVILLKSGAAKTTRTNGVRVGDRVIDPADIDDDGQTPGEQRQKPEGNKGDAVEMKKRKGVKTTAEVDSESPNVAGTATEAATPEIWSYIGRDGSLTIVSGEDAVPAWAKTTAKRMQ